MSKPTPDEPEEETRRGFEHVRLFVSDLLILVGRAATMRQLAQRMASFPNVTSFWPLLPETISTRRLPAISTAVAWSLVRQRRPCRRRYS